MPRLTNIQNTTSIVSGGNDPMWYTTIYHDTLDVTPWAGLAINNKGNIIVGSLINSTDYVYTCLDKNGNILNATNFGADGYYGELHPDTNSNNFYCYTNDAAVGAAGGKLLLLNERANAIVDSISLTGGEFAKGGSTLGRERLWDSCRTFNNGILIPWTGTTDTSESQAIYVSNTDGVLAVETTPNTADFSSLTRTPVAAAYNGQGDWISIFERSGNYQQLYQSSVSGTLQSNRYIVSSVDSWGTGLYIDRTGERVYTDITISGTTYNAILTTFGSNDIRALEIRRSAGFLLPDNRYDYIITHWAQRTDPSAIDPTDVYVGGTVDMAGSKRYLFISQLLSNSSFSSLDNTIQIELDNTSFNPELKSMKFDNRGNLYVYLHGQYNGLSCGQLFKINVDYQINNTLDFNYTDANTNSRVWNYTGETPSTKGTNGISFTVDGTGGANDGGYGSSPLSVTTTDYGITNLNSNVSRPV